MRLLIISNMSHYKQNGKIFGWGPTVQEIDYLSQLFEEVRHIACLHSQDPPLSALPYTSPHVHLIPIAPSGGDTLREKLKILLHIPKYIRIIVKELKLADVVHVRAPANVALVAIILLLFMRHPRLRWVKYAGNWQPTKGEPRTYTFQRWWLNKGLHRGVVTVNGSWEGQPLHVYSFENPTFSSSEIAQAHTIGEAKTLKPPYQLLYVGRVTKAKGVHRALEIAGALKAKGLQFHFHVVGDGTDRVQLEQWVTENDLQDEVSFHGWVPKPALVGYYSNAHFLIFPSSSEGWAKVLSEAMAYGVVPIASDVSSIPKVLKETGAGVALPPNNIMGFAEAVINYTIEPGAWKKSSLAGINVAHRFSYENYLAQVQQLFTDIDKSI